MAAETKSGSIVDTNVQTTKRVQTTDILNTRDGSNSYAWFHDDASIKVEVMDWSCTRSDKSNATLNWSLSWRIKVWGSYGTGYILSANVYIDNTYVKTITFKEETDAVSGDTRSGTVTFSTTTKANSCRIKFIGDCHQPPGWSCDSTGWTQAYPDSTKTSAEQTLVVPEYQNWTAPTGASNVSASPFNVKPDGTVTVSWTAAHGGTNSPVTYYTLNYSKNGGTRTAYDSNVNINLTSKTVNLSTIGVKSGDKLVFDIDTYCTNIDGQGHAGWVGYSSSGQVKVYKDGCIYYKNSSGTKKECNFSYYKNSSGTKKTNRYMKVKDSGGTTHVIDVIE